MSAFAEAPALVIYEAHRLVQRTGTLILGAAVKIPHTARARRTFDADVLPRSRRRRVLARSERRRRRDIGKHLSEHG